MGLICQNRQSSIAMEAIPASTLLPAAIQLDSGHAAMWRDLPTSSSV